MDTQPNSTLLLDFDEYAEKTNPVFIFGSPRSGTTLTYHIMKFHPQVVKLPADTYFFKHFWNIRNKVPTKALHKILLVSSGLYTPYSKTLQGQLEADQALSRTLLNLIKEGEPEQIFSFISYIGYYQQASHIGNNSVKWWAERSNHHIFHYQTLKDWFPACKFIFCVRDPRAVIASELGHHRMKGEGPSSVSNYCLGSAIDWVRRNQLAFEAREKFADDVFISRYEDLVRMPVDHINRMWKFLSIPKMDESDIEEQINQLGPIYKSKTGVKRSTGIDTRSVDRWRQILSPTDAAIIEDVAEETAVLFGYEYADNNLSTTFYVRKFPSDNWKSYGKRLAKVLLLKLLPGKLFEIIELTARLRTRIARLREALTLS